MRYAAITMLFLTLAGCSVYGDEKGCDYKGHHHELGEIFPDECNGCTCRVDGVYCTLEACGPPADANLTCVGQAPYGVACAGYFCNLGEKCVGDVCTCGGHAACQKGDTCASAGPGTVDGCGSICCGPASGPCPL